MAIPTERTETTETTDPASARTGPPGSWRELFGPGHRATAVLIAGVMLLDGASTWVTTSLLPTAIEDIGGERFYAWTTTVFMIASVIAALLVSRVLSVRGPRGGFRVGIAAFASGTGVAAREAFFARLMPLLNELTVHRAVRDAGAYLDFLTAQPEVRPGPVGVVGYCMGAVLAVRAAAARPGQVAATACFHLGPLVTAPPTARTCSPRR